MTGASTLAQEFAKSHGEKVGEIMTSDVVWVEEETPLSEVALLLERKRIKRVLVTRDGKLVGIVSQSNLVQTLASIIGGIEQPRESDRQTFGAGRISLRAKGIAGACRRCPRCDAGPR